MPTMDASKAGMAGEWRTTSTPPAEQLGGIQKGWEFWDPKAESKTFDFSLVGGLVAINFIFPEILGC